MRRQSANVRTGFVRAHRALGAAMAPLGGEAALGYWRALEILEIWGDIGRYWRALEVVGAACPSRSYRAGLTAPLLVRSGTAGAVAQPYCVTTAVQRNWKWLSEIKCASRHGSCTMMHEAL
jgi:hypothetical protein